MLTSIFGCGWLESKWTATLKVKAKLFKLFPSVSKTLNTYRFSLISIHKLKSYLPLDVH